jgi:trimethylamine--corrinoid protein Co-methyltransferase
MWVTGYPSAQSGGSTSIINDIPAAVEESELSRNTLREYGVHILRHAMGALGSLNYFSLDKFIQDCDRERESRKIWLRTRHDFVVPLYFPEDRTALQGIREIAEKGGAKNADHTLKNTGSFLKWQKEILTMGEKRVYFPELRNSLQNAKGDQLRTSKEERAQQLQDTLFPDSDTILADT